MLSGSRPSLKRRIFPPVGPPALIIRSSSRLVTTSGNFRYPSGDFFLASKISYPVVTTMAAASMTISFSASSCRIACGPQAS